MTPGQWRTQLGARWWTATVLVVLVLAASPLAEHWLGTDGDSVSAVTGVVGLTLAPVTLAAALFLYVHWRTRRANATGWLTAALVAAPVVGLVFAASTLAQDRAVEHTGWLLLHDLVFMGVLLVMVTVLRHRVPPLDPALMGIGLGASMALVRVALLPLEPLLASQPALLAGGNVALLGLCSCFAWAALRLGVETAWATAFPVAVLVLAVVHAVSYPVVGNSFLIQSALVANLSIGVLLTGSALAVVHAAFRGNLLAVADLSSRVAEAEHDRRKERERIHEINATVAGIVHANRLLREQQEVASDCRLVLEDLLTSETDRLQRLVSGRAADGLPFPAGVVDLDRTIRGLVLARQSMGHRVHWQPARVRVQGHDDAITEVLTTLLDNAAQHAPGAPVSIATRVVGDHVEVSVADHGPGIPGDMAERIFEWGEHRPDSPGQGIGLHVARRLMLEIGGSLLVVPSQPGNGRGAAFVMKLPTTGDPDGTDHSLAQ